MDKNNKIDEEKGSRVQILVDKINHESFNDAEHITLLRINFVLLILVLFKSISNLKISINLVLSSYPPLNSPKYKTQELDCFFNN